MIMKNITIIYLLMGFIFASCLPQEKTTQCASNEAYNATSRSCVATLGANGSTVNISNVTPASSYAISTNDTAKTHSITVSDNYNNGYTVKWNLTQPNGSVVLLGTGLSLTFNHSSYPSGSYIIEVQLLDSSGVKVFDTRSWTVNITTNSVPSFSFQSATPFSTNTNGSPSTLSATITNTDAILYGYQWYINGTAQGVQTFINDASKLVSFTFDPTNSASYHNGAGIYSAQLILQDASSNIYNQASWTISNNIPGFTTSSLGTSTAFATATPSTAASISAIIDTDISQPNAFLSDVDNDGDLDSIDFCVQVADVSGVDNQGVWVDFLSAGVKVAGGRFTVNDQEICLGDFDNDGTFDTNYQVSIASIHTHSESLTLSAVVFDEYSGSSANPAYSSGTQLQRYDWSINKRRANTPPKVTIDESLTNVHIAGSTSHTCSKISDTSQTNCHITQDTEFDLAIEVQDDDYTSTDYSKYQVEFEVDGVDLDGSTPTVSTSDCVYGSSENNTAAKFVCKLTIQSFDRLTGPIDHSSANYTISAKVTDTGSPYSATGVESNSVSWSISTVDESNTDSSILAFNANTAGLDATINTTDSFIAKQSNSGISIDTTAVNLIEGDIIEFAVNVQDAEADSHKIDIARCTSITCLSTYPTMVSKIIASTSGSTTKMSLINYTISQDDVTSASAATVYYKVTVSSHGTTVASNPVSEVFSALIQNTNPEPTFDGTPSPAVGTNLVAFTGFPLTLNPGPITDTSITDGDEVTYQWILSEDAGTSWKVITGANQHSLTWTPSSQLDFSSQSGTPVEIKLCIGDEGFGNDLLDGANNCSANNRDSAHSSNFNDTWNITVYSNMAFGEDPVTNDSTGEIAVWVDPTTTNPIVKYMAYSTASNQIVVEKIVTFTDGSRGGTENINTEIQSISFPSTSVASSKVSYLSMSGDSVNKTLYLSYMAPYPGTNAADAAHIRRIDISGGKTAFLHDGKFGMNTDYSDPTTKVTVSSAEIANEVINANGLIELDVQSISAATSTIVFSGIFGGSVNLVEGVDFCTTTCTTTTQMADSIVDAINSSSSSELQGITAWQSSDVVTLSGLVQDDFIQEDINASALGSIMVNQTTGKWEVPFIDNGQPNPNKNTISIMYGDLNQRLTQTAHIKTSLTVTSPSQEIANTLDQNDRIVLVSKAFSTGEIAVYDFSTTAGPAYNLASSASDIFTSPNVANFKVSVGRTAANTSAYIVGKNIENNEIAFARIPYSAGYSLASAYTSTDLDSSFTMFDSTTNFDISAGAQSNELFIGQVNSTDQSLYLLQVKGASPVINCNIEAIALPATTHCQKIRPLQTSNISDLPVAMADIQEDRVLGSVGDIAAENTKDILVIGFHVNDTQNKATTAIINVEETDIHGEANSATNFEEIYNVPYVAK